MNELQIFRNDKFGEIRTVEIDKEIKKRISRKENLSW